MNNDALAESNTFRMFIGNTVAGSTNGATIDTKGFRSAVAIISATSLSGIGEIFVEESEDDVTWNAVPDEAFIGRDPAQTTSGKIADLPTASTTLVRVGINSKKRYLRGRHATGGTSYGVLHFLMMDAVNRPTAAQVPV